MTTVDDKLKLFAKIVFENVEKDSERKVSEFTKMQDQLLEEEKQKILKQSENLIKQTKKKAETRKNETISKVNIDRQHEILKKRKEIYDRTIEDIKNRAAMYTDDSKYLDFLEKCISKGLTIVGAEEITVYFKEKDIERYKEKINGFIKKYKKDNMKISIKETNDDILGGCIFEDATKTLRVDCSMASLIDDNRGLIGKELIDSFK